MVLAETRMSVRPASDKDYVLGTHDEEIARLGLQHKVWRERVLAFWKRAGLEPGTRVVDVGAGPGYGTLELAHTVGREGEIGRAHV